MHETADGEVCHQQSIKLLPNQLRSLTAQDDLSPAQMRLELIERRLYFPPLMVQRRQFSGKSLLRIQNGRDQPIERFGICDALQLVIDHSYDDAFAPVPAIGGRTVD